MKVVPGSCIASSFGDRLSRIRAVAGAIQCHLPRLPIAAFRIDGRAGIHVWVGGEASEDFTGYWIWVGTFVRSQWSGL